MVGKAVLQFLQVVILARLLTPEDFGLMALVVAVIMFVQIFSDMGISNAIIHHQQITQEELSSLYWLNVSAGAVLMLLLLLVSPVIAGFYNLSDLEPLLMVISAYFFIGSLGQQLKIMAEKELRFASLALIELIAAFMGFIVTVVWALKDANVMALIVGMITSISVMSLLNWMILAQGWRPMWRLHIVEIRHFLSFGGYTIANNVVNSINLQADILIGGRTMHSQDLGMYSLPRDLGLRLSGIINPIVTRVGLPVMAKAQHDKAFLKKVYLKTLRMTASINAPIYLALAMFAPEVVTLVFGNQWIDTVPLLRVLALWALFRSFGNPVGSLLFATGHADWAFKWNVVLFFFIIPMLLFGSQWGGMGLAITQLMVTLILFIPGWYFLVRPLCGAGLKEYTINLIIPIMTSVMAASVAYLCVWMFSSMLFRLFLGVSVGILVYVLLSWFWNRQWYNAMRELIYRKVDI